MKKYCFLASVLATLLSNANPVSTDYTWKAVNGDYSGTFNDPAHWDNGQVPGALARANFAAANNYTLTLPYGNYDSYCNFKFFIGNNCVNVIDGRSSVFRMPGTEVDNYLNESFIFQGSGGHFFNLEAYEADAAVRFKYPHAELSNVMMTFTNDNNKVRAHFNEGIFKFNGVDGSVLTKLPRLTLFHCSGAEGSIHFHENSTLIAPNIELRGNVNNTLLSFDGGTHYIDGQLRIPSNNFVPSEKVTTFEVKDTADVKINSAQIGSSVGVKIDGVSVPVKSTNRVFNVVVKDGGTMSFYGDVNHSVGGTLNFDVLNGSYLYATNATNFGRDKDCPNFVRIVDSYSCFKKLRSGYVTPTLLGVTNSTFDVTADWYVYNG